MHDIERRNKTCSDHFYDDTVNAQCNNVLVDKFKVDSTSKEGTDARNINQNKSIRPTASEAHSDISPPHLPPKPIKKSFHKSFSSESANKPTASPATKTDGNQSAGKDLSPSNLLPKPIVKSKMSSSNKPTVSPATKATHGDPPTDKHLSPPHLPPKPTVKSIHKPVSSSNKLTASAATKANHDDPSTGKDVPPKPHIPPKPIMKSIHESLLLRQHYALLDMTSRKVTSEYQKPNCPPPLPPKHKKISTNH